MNLKTKQHVCNEFCVRLEKLPEGTIALLKKAFGDVSLSNLRIKKRHKEFKDGQKSVHNASQCGKPRTSVTEININTIVSIIEDD